MLYTISFSYVPVYYCKHAHGIENIPIGLMEKCMKANLLFID